MDSGSEPYEESGVRRRRSGEHEGSDPEEERGSSVTETRTLSRDGEPVAQSTATDVSAASRPRSAAECENVHISKDIGTRLSKKKRKSDEISRDGSSLEGAAVTKVETNEDVKPFLSVDTNLANESSSRNAVPSTRSASRLSPPAGTSPRSPSSPASRSRGMSLRTSIFTRNIDRKSFTEGSNIEMRNVGTHTRPGTAKSAGGLSITEAPVLEWTESNESDSIPKHGPVRLTSPEFTRASSRKSFQGILTLPNYHQWVQQRANHHLPIKRIKEAYQRSRKFLLRIQEIPPSKDGRHIPLDPSRKNALLDERTGHPYVSNFIKSSKYTAWNFLPRQLVAQFSKLANLYFLTISILQMIPGLSTTGTYTTIIPLMFFISISMAKEGYEDLRRHRLDKAENNREANVMHAYQPIDDSDTDESQRASEQSGPIHWAPVKWQSLQVGDIVRLKRDEAVPADILLLESKGDNSIAYVETMALDGETNLKTKQPSGALIESCKDEESIAALRKAEIVVEDPNLDLYNFEGKVSVNGEWAPLTNNEVLYRGSVLRNTPQATGIVVYSGEECKIRMNANKNPRIKAPSLQAMVNKIVMCIVIFVVSLALLCTILYQVWHFQFERSAWYLTHARVDFGPVIVSFIIMYNTMIPLSLYVSLEIIKVAQMYLMNDIDMYDPVSNTPFEARTSTINEELGQVSYIFSDKTGTLTENVMRFRKLSVAGTAWLHDDDVKKEPQEDMLMHKKRKSKGKGPLHRMSRKSTANASLNQDTRQSNLDVPQTPRKSTATWRSGVQGVAQPELTTTEMVRYVQHRPHTVFARKARMLILSLALCHTCLPERGEGEDDISYQASSPDELALVQAARDLGYFAFDRQVNTLTIKTYPRGFEADPILETYEILDVIEFSSKRKRMSVVVRQPDGRICILCKGADSVITERLRLATLANQKIAEIEKRVHHRRSVEAQEALRRRSNVERQSSIGGLPRVSFAGPSMRRSSVRRLASIRDEVDGWLRDREQDFTPSVDASHYSPRPSAQIHRPSAAISEHSTHSDSDITPLVDESLVVDDSAVIERCFQHVNDFATEGLRTLLYGHRFITAEEYRAWKRIYQEATTSLTDRQKMIEAAGELIERDLELTGATAIEDKLQEGVPDTIDRLRRANISLWMLTGDKRETAINIGHSCRLIKDYSSVTILDSEAGGVEQSIAEMVVQINEGNVAHAVVVIDGRTLANIQEDEALHTLFLDLAVLADSVVCCRASPSQKAHLVHSVRRRVNRSVTLAIGDGANDIAMIQEAHVGIGITGKEGLQAARTSDYSIAQFKFLNKLLLVHGRWNYIRTCKYTLGTFWKEMLFFLTQALYQQSNGWTGTSLYEQWSLSQFNTLFTSLPVIFLGIFEKDLAAATLLAVPELYNKGQRFAGFNFRVYLSWMFMAVSESILIFFTTKALWGEALFTNGDDLFSMGQMTFTACIVLINCKLQLLEQRNRTVVALICLVIETGGWFLWNVIFSLIYGDNYEYNVKGGFTERFGKNPLWWLCLILIVASCLLFEIATRAWKNAIIPTDVETFQQLERDLGVRRRFEEASAPLLQAGWNHGTKRSSLELQREAEEQARREGEVQDLLVNRPREMEEGRSTLKKSTAEEHVAVVEDAPIRRSTEIREMLSRRFGSVREGTLRSSSVTS